MSINIEEAKKLVKAYSEETGAIYFDDGIIEKDEYWFFPIGYTGSSGVIVNKSNLRLFPMGSALSKEEMFWGHENGFSPEKVDIEITEVSNDLKVTNLVSGLLVQLNLVPSVPSKEARELAHKKMEDLPLILQGVRLWLSIPWFMQAKEENWLKYSIKEHHENT